jgi:capsular polysaccharide biosynthesis protein
MRPEREPARDQPRPLTDLEAEREVSLAGVGQTILRRWWLVAAAVVMGAVIGYLLSLGGGNVFQARATVYPGNQLSPSGNQAIQSPATNPATVGQVARSDEVVQDVARRVGVDPARLRRGISTKQVGGTQTRTTTTTVQLVEIGVRGPWRAESAEAANLIATIVVDKTSGYVDVKIKAQEELLAGQTRELAEIESRINDFNAAVSSAQGLSQVERLIVSTQLSLFEQQRGQLLEQQAETRQLLELARQVERGRVLTKAVATKVPARSPKSSIVAGGVIGLLIGIALALLWTPLVASRRAPTPI